MSDQDFFLKLCNYNYDNLYINDTFRIIFGFNRTIPLYHISYLKQSMKSRTLDKISLLNMYIESDFAHIDMIRYVKIVLTQLRKVLIDMNKTEYAQNCIIMSDMCVESINYLSIGL